MRRVTNKAKDKFPKIKISKSLIWVEKYLKRSKGRMPALILPKKIRSYKPSVGKKLRSLGGCCKADKTVTLATHYDEWIRVKSKKIKKLLPLSQVEILQTLAHEIAHLEYDHHGYEQRVVCKNDF